MPNIGIACCCQNGTAELAAFMQRLTITHVRRWQEHRRHVELGHV